MDYLTTRLVSTLSNRLADAVERIAPLLVMIHGRRGYLATGVVAMPNLVVTANHVLEGEANLTIQTNECLTLSAQLAGRDPATDLAVLRVAGLDLQAPVATEPARIGQLVLAMGRTPAEGLMMRGGFVSAIGGPLCTAWGVILEQYFRIDATLDPPFSGGPLIDTQGAVLGVTTTGVIKGTALTIPVDIAWQIAETLEQQGFIKRGFLGLSCQMVQIPPAQRDGRTQPHGLLITDIEEHSPAATSGFFVGDIVVTFDGRDVSDFCDLQLMLTGSLVGTLVSIGIIRGATLRTLDITVGQRGAA